MALEFERAAAHAISNRYIPRLEPPIIMPDAQEMLEEAGLILDTRPLIETITAQGDLAMDYGQHAIIVVLEPGATFQLPVVPLTRAGREVIKLIERPFPLPAARIIAERVAKTDAMKQIVFGPIIDKGADGALRIGLPTVLWAKATKS